MIELAPHHKIGLPLDAPLLIAAGFGGYGDSYTKIIDDSLWGAIVTAPITLRPRRRPPHITETAHGLLLDRALYNPGVKKVLRQYGPLWTRLTVPVIAHLPADEPDDLRRTARAVATGAPVAAIELGLPYDAHPDEVERWVQAVWDGCELPLLAKLPVDAPPSLVEIVAELAIDAMVIGTPPLGRIYQPQSGQFSSGAFYGPALHMLTLQRVSELAPLVGCPLVAGGGVHTTAQAKALLTAGAVAVQLDSLLWVDPGQAAAIAHDLADKSA